MAKSTLTQAVGLAGIGLAAGLSGALLMSLSQKAEMAVTKREPSTTPSDAAETLVGTELDETEKQKLSTPLHLAFGSALGLGLAALAPVPEPARTGLFFAGAWGAGNGLTTALDVADPPTQWDAKQLAIDLLHHAVYAVGATMAFFGLRRLARL
jgi:hypothetical protein